jgi:UTP--glucose-1-phosphate uridylyltransferase
LGTRFLPASKAIPKELVPIVDKPTIQYIVEEAVASGIEYLVLITSRGKSAIEDHFDISVELEAALREKGNDELLKEVRDIAELIEVHSVRQKEPRGLGHAVLCARDAVGEEPFAVLLGDDVVDNDRPCLAQMVDVFNQQGGGVVALQQVSESEAHLYGIIRGERVADRVYRIEDLVEKPPAGKAPTNLAVIGRYVLPPEIFPILETTAPGRGGEIQLTDALQELARRQPLYGYEFIGDRYDAGDKAGYVEATIAFALKRPEMAERIASFIKERVGM